MGSRLGIGKAPSLATTQGSETHPRIALNEQEIEGSYSSSSETESMSGSGDMYYKGGLHEPEREVGTSLVDATPSYQLEFNIKLKFDYTNAWGAEIYHDPMQRQVYKTADCPTPFEKAPWVNYQGDMYVGEDGARYEVTDHPHKVDATGYLLTDMNDVEDISLRRGIGPNLPTTSRGSKGPGTSTNPFDIVDTSTNEQVHEELEVTTGFTFETGMKTIVKDIPVWRIFQDDINKVVYRDDQGYCYATRSASGLRLLVSYTLTMEEPHEGTTLIRDA